ncbi:prepilin-type N-terminal cleavage/methylation domain-containing protein [Luteolibacter ambystomatis]|uniref:Prepilin-type N-terminal cleavage/methylation domain-containing protein n=1 Tax=Luteolibacter ambystomatis TaxID=2824561 RepID=A0A975G904_9BACT|nr:prepilin-type N-terminal cleavage/methylation domain-containing protein [Luteolibacter ambystomatis]QUE51037.1 prepilin-type N-terminal cleavage/methylation domain-containing protein [Luteolibacter ambystomatis]
MKTSIKRRKGFTLVELLVVIAIIVALAGIATPMLLKQQKKAASTQALSNARQIGLALFDFDSDYSNFPDRTTADSVKEATGSSLTLQGGTSNDYFRQLIAAGITTSEEIFFAKLPYTKKPDNVITGDKALADGEVGFGYLMNDQSGFSTTGNSARPIIATPLLNASSDGTFDSDPFDQKAIVLRLDNSAVSYQINQNTKTVVLPGGKGLLSTGEDTVWGTDVNPRIVAPSKKR